jgi:hypothetical protein
MNMRVHLIHGFNVDDEGAETIDTLRPLIERYGYRVKEHNYPDFFLLRARLCNQAMASMIRDSITPGDPVIAHSNGAAIVYRAAKAGARFGHVTLINPALNKKLAIPNARSIHVWHSPSDPWTNLARYIPCSIWGAQGRTGYTGDDPRYTNFNEDSIFSDKVKHSGMFADRTRRRVLVSRAIESL